MLDVVTTSDIMVYRSLPLLLLPLVGSFVLPSIRPLHSEAPFRERPRQHVNFNRAAVRSDPAGALSMKLGRTPPAPGCRRSSRLRSQQEQASVADTAVSELPAPQALPEFISNDGVSYWVHQEKESNIWLAGVVHGTEAGEKLAAEVISGVKPEVVMVELDAHRISLLPPGEAMETRNGLWWWSPEEEEEASDETDDDDEEDDDEIEPPRDMSEISVAVREARACGARVLLGDRDYETTARLLKKAKRADMASAKEREKFSELTASFDCEDSTREVTRKECAQMKQQAPKVFAVMCTQRDQVMAKNLMKLRGEQTTVAVFGLAHLDGVEKVLKGHGWKRQWPQP